MQKIVVTGGKPLHGEVTISGAKNAVLPILCATLLADAPVEITNVPHLHDVVTTVKLLGELGAGISIDEGTLSRGSAITVDPRSVNQHVAPYELVKTMRASILVLGPLLAKLRRGRSLAAGRLRDRLAPGRPAHQGPAGAGRRDHRSRTASSRPRAKRLKGARYVFDMVSVDRHRERADGGDAWPRAPPCSRTRRMEPEVIDLADCLIAMGARIEGAGTSRIVDRRRGAPARRSPCGAAGPDRDRHLPGRRGDDRRQGHRHAVRVATRSRRCWTS